MSHLQYFSYKGFGEHMRDVLSYSQAVRIGDRIEISGQGMSLASSYTLLIIIINHIILHQEVGTQKLARFTWT